MSASTKKSKIIHWANNNIIIVIIWIIVATTASFITITQGVNTVFHFYQKLPIFKEKKEYKLLESLKVNSNINNISNVLGYPQLVERLGPYMHYIFLKEDFYVTALTDKSDKILMLAITSRKKNFQPTFIVYDGDPNKQNIKITLNKSKFKDISKDYQACYFLVGARRYKYFEEMYFGNPSNYQTIYYGINDAGYTKNFTLPKTNDLWQIDGDLDKCKLIDDNFRENIINTYAITAPFFDLESIKISTSSAIFLPGPDLDQVRVW